MGLSEAEIEARLALLRRQREALDREIADLVLYLELGRRLAASRSPARPEPVPVPETAPDRGSVLAANPADSPAPPGPVGPETRSGPASGPASGADAAPRGDRVVGARPGPRSAGAPGPAFGPGAIPPAIAFAEDAAGARRYGRAVVQAACAAIARAGRPLHAAEILEVLAGQGFTLPGRDPVAALNTRLWKRSGPGGPLSRVGEATYALASTPESPEPDPA
ncbi:hypothetical protein CIW48_26355 [Methylobacterium sp. P1-11]|uniref:hypothetical protein n=1 Tax=Methylobacterium sp. P1-11 TaxID=2024616 RepID=UPI0011ECBCE9|nr:hypothetical protein [Methylobacterium sp. P1-11]KAA0119911.1 hypothetical protein CIW48_26355 [Methylobacterium sp. P1-11]